MRAALLVLTFLVSGNVLSEGVSVAGVGTFSCGKYLQLRVEKNAAQDAAFVSWIWGYLAGFNMESLNPTSRDLPDQPSTLAYVDKYCQANPLDNVLIATNSLIQELGGKRRLRK